MIGAGTCTINANQVGNAQLPAGAAGAAVLHDLRSRTQTISFTSTPPGGATVGDPAYTVAATASSGLAVTFAVGAGSAGICSLSGSSVTFVSAGTCTINANQAGNGSYQAAPQVQQSFAISAASSSTQSINFTSSAPAGASVGGADIHRDGDGKLRPRGRPSRSPPAAPASARSPARRSRFVGAGTCTINANQAGNAQLPGRAAGAAVLHGQPPHTNDQLHLDAARRCDRRRCDLHRFGDGLVGPRGDVHDRRRQRRHLHPERLDRLVRRRRHLHDQRQPGRQRQLPGSGTGAAVLRGRQPLLRRRAVRRSRSPRRPRPAPSSAGRPTP